MNGFPQYSVCMQETHHVHKLDAPSGTAITLAEEIIDNIDRKKDWKRGVTYWTEDGHHDEGDANITMKTWSSTAYAMPRFRNPRP